MSCHKSFGSSDKLGLKVVIRPLLGRQARKLAPLENVDKATSRRAFPLCPYRRFNNRLKFSLRRLILKKKKRNFIEMLLHRGISVQLFKFNFNFSFFFFLSYNILSSALKYKLRLFLIMNYNS